MAFTVNLNPTVTGGTATTLTPAGNNGGKASFVTPSSTRLQPQSVDVLTSSPTPSGQNPGVARGGLKVAFASRVTEEGCCTVNAGTIIADVSVRWPLSQPATVVDDVISWVRALVLSPQFADAVKKGILPS